MNRLLKAALVCALGISAHASTTSVTATLTDSDSIPWANCTWSAVVLSQYPPTIAGVAVPASSLRANGSCNASGALSATMLDTSSVQQSGVTWTFTLQPNASAASSVVYSVSVTGASIDLSSTLSTGLKGPRFGAGPNAYGYADIEVNSSSLGSTYFNTGTVCGGPSLRQLSQAGWKCGGGSGGGGTIASTTDLISGDGSGNGVSSGIAAANVAKLAPLGDQTITQPVVSSIQTSLNVNNLISNGFTTPPISAQTQSSGYTAYDAHGDSITVGQGATSSAFGYVSLVAAASGTTSSLNNYGVAGDQACDAVNHVFNQENPGATSTVLQTLMIGTNDAGHAGAGAYEAIYNNCHQAALSWIATPSTTKYTGASFGSIPTNWSLDTTFSQVSGIKTTTNGAVSVWPVTTTAISQSIFIWYRLIDGNGGVFSYSDTCGDTAGRASNFTAPAIATQNGATSGVGVIVLPLFNRAIQSCSVTITAQSATSGGNIVSILAVGTSPATITSTTPQIWSAGVPRLLNDSKQFAYESYNQDAINNVAVLQSAGLAINFVNVRSYIYSQSAEMNDNVHPNNSGHAEIAASFLGSTQKAPYSTPLLQNSLVLSQSSFITATAYTVACGDQYLFFNTSANGTITLPSYCPNIQGVYVYNNSSTFTLTISASIAAFAGMTLQPGEGAILHFVPAFNDWFGTIKTTVPSNLVVPSFRIIGGSYTATCQDQILYATSAAIVALPSGCTDGSGLYVYNNNGSAANITFTGSGNATGLTLGSTQWARITYSVANSGWFILNTNSKEINTSIPGFSVVSGTFTATCLTQTVYATGSTVVTMPTTCNTGTSVYIYNNSSGTVTFTGSSISGAASLGAFQWTHAVWQGSPYNGWFALNSNSLDAPLASPALTGTPTAPTAATSTNTTQLANTAFVQAVAASSGTTATLSGSGGTSVSCVTAACTNRRGTLSIAGGTATTGTIAVLSWSATPSTYVCTASENGGTGFLGIGNDIATTTGLNISAGVAVTGLTVLVNYSCQP